MIRPSAVNGSNMFWLNVAILTLVSTAFVAPPGAAGKRPPAARIYVFAHDPAEPASEDDRGLADSVRDLIEVLRGRSEFTVVASAAQAQVRVEVVNREERDAPQGGFGGQALTRFRETIVRLRVESGTGTSDLKGVGRPSWKAAAKDAADRLSKWVKSHPPSPHPGASPTTP